MAVFSIVAVRTQKFASNYMSDLRFPQRWLWRMQSAATCSRWFLARGIVYPEDVGDRFLRNFGSHKIYAAPHSRRRHSSNFMSFFYLYHLRPSAQSDSKIIPKQWIFGRAMLGRLLNMVESSREQRWDAELLGSSFAQYFRAFKSRRLWCTWYLAHIQETDDRILTRNPHETQWGHWIFQFT
jgi:hypothetical protein